jgi:hypothetical protein
MSFWIKEKLKMKKYAMALVGAVAVCVLLGFVSNATAEDVNQPRENPGKTPKETPKDKESLIIGIVSVIKDNDGNVTEIKVKAHKDLIYRVTLDEKGKEIGKTMADKKVRAVGTLEIKGDVKWLTVKTFSEVVAKSESKEKPKGKDKPAAKPDKAK